MEPRWLEWATRLQALAQNGLTFTTNPFDIERYQAVRAVAAEMIAAGSGVPIERVLDLFSLDVGYATPKIDVRGAVFRGDALLLVRERADNNRWTLPGGWADIGGSPSENAEREIYEESGYRTRATKVVAIFDRRKHGHLPLNPHHIYKILFLCELIGGEAAGSAETDGAAFFHQAEVPADLSLGRVTPEQITRIFEHHRHPEWPTDFD